MAESKYTNPEKAVDVFDNLLASGNVVSIDEFLSYCSSNIQEKIRPLLELVLLFRDYSKKAPRGYFADLLSSTTSEEISEHFSPKRYDFPFETTRSVESLETRLIIDETMPIEPLEKRSMIDDLATKDSEDNAISKRLFKFLRRLVQRGKRHKPQI